MSEQISDDSYNPGGGGPRVLILGAGASRAAWFSSGMWGPALPTMDDFVTTIGLAPLLQRHGVEHKGRNFESIYSQLLTDGRADVVQSLELALREYFGALQLPDYPTMYDHLVMSLCDTDVVATFNWDPFLHQACSRNRDRRSQSEPRFLHGSIGIGYRGERGRLTFGDLGEEYPKPVPFTRDEFIASSWGDLDTALTFARVLAVFGFSMSDEDADARERISSTCGVVERIEIIDPDAAALKSKWQAIVPNAQIDVCEGDNGFLESRFLFRMRDRFSPKSTHYAESASRSTLVQEAWEAFEGKYTEWLPPSPDSNWWTFRAQDLPGSGGYD
jgi:hypothetical protein